MGLVASHANISKKWPQITESLNDVDLFDTTDGAKLVARIRNGETEVVDPDGYAFFLGIKDLKPKG